MYLTYYNIKKLVLLRISKSCKRTDLGGSVKNRRIRFRILDGRIINLCLQTCGFVSVHRTAAKWRKSVPLADTFTLTLENYLQWPK